MMSAKTPAITIPDLRFEQSFMRSLNKYAEADAAKKSRLSTQELQLLDTAPELSEDGDVVESGSDPLAPLAPITPGIVIYAIFKDQILMPLIQGFLWSGLLLCVRPFLGLVVANGQRWGTWVANGLGLHARRKL